MKKILFTTSIAFSLFTVSCTDNYNDLTEQSPLTNARIQEIEQQNSTINTEKDTSGETELEWATRSDKSKDSNNPITPFTSGETELEWATRTDKSKNNPPITPFTSGETELEWAQ